MICSFSWSRGFAVFCSGMFHLSVCQQHGEHSTKANSHQNGCESTLDRDTSDECSRVAGQAYHETMEMQRCAVMHPMSRKNFGSVGANG